MKKSAALSWLLLFPTLLVLVVFVLYPALRSIYFSFYDVAPFSLDRFFVGFDNYQVLLSSQQYWKSIRVSGVFTLLTAVPSVVLGLAIAVLLDLNPFIRNVFRTLFLFPVAISSAMAAMLWIFIYNPTAGYLNYMLDQVGIIGPNWLSDPNWALLAVSIPTVWKELGFNIIFFLAGLASIPKELEEAAVVDGANFFQKFFHITLPMLSPTIFFVSVVAFIHAMESFGQIHLLTAGGPISETNTLVYNLYRDGFVNFRTGQASAQAVVLFVLLMLATTLQFAVAKRKVHYAAG